MSSEEITLLAIKGLISQLADADRAKVEQCIAEIRAVLAQYPREWQGLAVALLGAEMQLELDQ